MQDIEHPFVTSLQFAFQTDIKLYIGMKFYQGGDLFMQLLKKQKLKEPYVKFVVIQLALALSYLHSKGIVYRDLKSENIMIDNDGFISLIDYGISKRLTESEPRTNTFCGTMEYMSPQ